MKLILPPGVSRSGFDAALGAFERVVGAQWVLATDDDRETYLDIYAPGDEDSHAPSAAVAPASTAEVQALVRIANEHRIPLWPISRGKNFGYGGAAPRMSGTVVLDLGRMRRIVEVDPECGYCVLEPGVGFFDLYEHLQTQRIPLWLSLPGNAWGSVVGNALERGFSATPYGEHSACICGMEVVLPQGEVVRTGMGAMRASATAALFKHGFGPSWDQMFVQSNFGIVTQMGFWLMPEPEATTTLTIHLPEPEDLGWVMDVLNPLRVRGVVQHNVAVTSYMGATASASQRSEWYQGPGALPDEAVRRIIAKLGLGWWNFSLRFYGDPAVNDANERIVRRLFAEHTKSEFSVSRWNRGDAPTGSGAPVPSVFPLQVVNWHGGRGGHLGFSPVLPPRGRDILAQLERTRRRFAEFGVDYSGTFYAGGRHVVNVNLMLYDRDDVPMTGRVRALFDTMVKDSAAAGYAEYRTHLTYMDEVAATFDYNDHALRRLNETIKDVLDPRGILAPGKNGIWPGEYRRRNGGK